MITNSVLLTGRVAFVKEYGRFTLLKLTVTTKVSTRTNERSVSNYPAVLWFGENKKIAAKFKQFDYVRIKGYISTYVQSQNGQTLLYQNIVGTSIESWVTSNESSKTNRITIYGSVASLALKSDSYAEFTLAVETNIPDERDPIIFYPTFRAFNKVAEFMKTQVRKGSKVKISASVETKVSKANTESSGDGTNSERKYGPSKEIYVCNQITVMQ